MMRTWARAALAAGFLAGGLAGAAGADDDPLAEAMARDPERLATRVTDLIAGFGQDGRLQPEGIEAHIALQRAEARATALRRLMAMDLDADGQVTRTELQVSQQAAGAKSRGRLERLFTAADRDASDRIDAAEMAAAGTNAADAALDAGEAALLRGLMRLDADGDGGLTSAEVQAALPEPGDDA